LNHLSFGIDTINVTALNQTLTWLLKKRASNAFTQNSGALDANFRAPAITANAYVQWALSFANLEEEIL